MNADRPQVKHRRPWPRIAGRFALAFLAVIVVGALSNALHDHAGPVIGLLTLGTLVVIVWAFLGLRRT